MKHFVKYTFKHGALKTRRNIEIVLLSLYFELRSAFANADLNLHYSIILRSALANADLNLHYSNILRSALANADLNLK